MRILHVTTFLQGGAGRVITDLAIAQLTSGHDVRVVVDAGGESGYASYPEYLDALTEAGIAVTTVRSTFKRDWALTTHAALELNQLARTWRPNLVHAHAAVPGVVARHAGLGGARRSAPILHTMHGWGIAKTPAQARNDVETLQQADGIATPSAASARLLNELGVSRDVSVIPYGIEPEECRLPPDEDDVRVIRSRADGPIALCLGTLGARKNQALLVDALALPSLRNVTALLIGDGDGASLTARAHERGVSERVVVLGHRAAASRYLSLASALVLPSRNEGLPIAVLEAMRAGVPVVATELPEIREALGAEHSQHLFPADDAAALARALCIACRRANDHHYRASLHSRFATHYTSARMVAAYDAWYSLALRS